MLPYTHIKIKFFLVLLPLTHEVLLEAPLPTGLGFAFVEDGVPVLYWSDEVIDVLSDEDFQNQSSSLAKEDIRDIEDGKVELNGSVLIDSGLTGGVGGDVGSNAVHLHDIVSFQKLDDRLCYKYIPLKYVNILMPESLDLLDVHSRDHPGRSDHFDQNLEPAPWGAGDIENLHPRPDDVIFFLNIEELESASSAIPESFRFVEIIIANDVLRFSCFLLRSNDHDIFRFSEWRRPRVPSHSDIFLPYRSLSCEDFIQFGSTSRAGEFLWCIFYS